jgi:hypothetical protein
MPLITKYDESHYTGSFLDMFGDPRVILKGGKLVEELCLTLQIV